MPITTTSELRSAAQWYPCPPNPDPADGLGDLVDLQTVSWTFMGLTLQADILLVRALAWDEATRTIQTGEIRLLASILIQTSGSRAVLTAHVATRAVLTGEQRAITSILTSTSGSVTIVTQHTASRAVVTGHQRTVELQE